MQLKICSRVSAKWRDLGKLVGLGYSDFDRFSKIEQNDPLICCDRVFDAWINKGGHGGRYPLTWQGLYNLLSDIEHQGVASDLETALNASLGVHIEKQ